MNQIIKLPVACGVFITRKCDLKCDYCNIPKITNDGELSVDEWKHAIDILQSMGVRTVNFLGGEPTLYDGITDLISYIANYTDMSCSLVTNANDKNKYAVIDELIDNGLNRVSVSIDSIDPEKSISAFKSMSGLALSEHLIERQYLWKDSFVLRDYCVLSTKNLNNLTDTVRYFDAKGIHTYFLAYHWSSENSYEHRKQINSLAITEESDIEKLKEQCNALVDLKRQGVLIDNSFEFFEGLPRYIQKLNWHCSRLSEIRIDYNGRMMCCCDRKGSVYNDYSIFDLENTDKLKMFLEQRQKDSAQCKGCMWSSSFEFEVESKKKYG